ncbi:MAG TPA: DUF2950 family protein [Alphaproteobacteria bacterium]|nr:DUF2950 family protein [Alphaproteobacteria bacterium]
MTTLYRRLIFTIGSVLMLLAATAAAVAQTAPTNNAANPEPAAQGPKRFATPEQAAHALMPVLEKGDTDALLDLVGHDYEDAIIGPDLAYAKARMKEVYKHAKEKLVLRHDSDDYITLVVGKDAWPMPIPIVRDGDQWIFDAEAGADEMLARRIGYGELGAIAALEAFVKAQREYAMRLKAAGKPVHYARYVQSTPGDTDGLWWNEATAKVAGPSPLDEFAKKQSEFLRGRKPGDPFRGYYFRILTGQGPHAKGGAKSYIVNGAMTGGFAMVAWPAEYRNSGVMTFMVNQDGHVMQKDLGEETASLVDTLRVYDPDDSWSPAE